MNPLESPQDSKTQLRHTARERRKSLPMARWSLEMQGKLLQKDWFRTAQHVLSYYPLPDEPDWLPLIGEIPGQTWYLPKTRPDKTITFYPFTEETALVAGPYGLKEPVGNGPGFEPAEPVAAMARPPQETILFVPALMMDRQGYRLGYGKGYYDRLLAGWRYHHVLSVGLIPEALLAPTLPREAHDLPVSLILTESQEIRLS